MTTAAAASAAMYSRPISHTPPDALSAVREALDQLAGHAPAAGAARALMDVHGFRCAPVDRDSQKPSAPPFASLVEVLAHFRQNPADGVALVAGPDQGRTVFAVEATPKAWAAWVADELTEVRVATDEQGREVGTDRLVRDLGAACVISWRPPPTAPTRTVAALGQAALQRAFTDLSAGVDRELASRPVLVAWSVAVAWSAPAEPDRRLELKSRKLAPGVRLVADGFLPWYIEQADGWTLAAAAGLQTAPLPDHLVQALGGRWTAPVATGGVLVSPEVEDRCVAALVRLAAHAFVEQAAHHSDREDRVAHRSESDREALRSRRRTASTAPACGPTTGWRVPAGSGWTSCCVLRCGGTCGTS